MKHIKKHKRIVLLKTVKITKFKDIILNAKYILLCEWKSGCISLWDGDTIMSYLAKTIKSYENNTAMQMQCCFIITNLGNLERTPYAPIILAIKLCALIIRNVDLHRYKTRRTNFLSIILSLYNL